MACTMMACMPEETSTEPASGCDLEDGTHVEEGWSGKDTGSNYCNTCRCSNGGLACTRMACAPQEPESQDGCDLSDGTHVPNGWSGKDTGDNWCNTCRCGNGAMACTMMACLTQAPSPEPANGCDLEDGTHVEEGWSGKGTGANHCNTCRCSNGGLACTRMACAPEEPESQDGCNLSDGTHVPSGWSGKDTGDNWCNSCSCSNGAMACTMMGCLSKAPSPEAANGCDLEDGTHVEDGWSGKDTGSNYCNTCRCSSGGLACTEMACLEKSQPDVSEHEESCLLSDGTQVSSGWSGKDTGANWCNSCRCGNGALACTRMMCAQKQVTLLL